jgi:hypothetical protein
MTAISVSTPHKDETAHVRDIENPNGVESWFGKEPFFWMGGGDTIVNIFSSDAGVARLTATLLPGPSLADKSKVRLRIVSPMGGNIEQNLEWGPARIEIPVRAGLNRIAMRALGRSGPNLGVAKDHRTMMIGFRNLQAAYRTVD